MAIFAAPAHAQGTPLMPGVTYEKQVQFTPHGAVVIHVLTAPRPGDQNGLYQLAPVLAKGTVIGGKQRVTQLQKDVSTQMTVAGINGDLFNSTDGQPAGIFMQGGLLLHPPLGTRSSIGVDSAGALHVDRVKFFGTWRGTGQRRPLSGLNKVPKAGEVILFTPAFGARTPAVPGAAEVVLQPFPAAAPNVDLPATVTATAVGGGTTIPPDGAVVMAAGATLAAALQAEAPIGTPLTTRLILQPAWTGVVSALGGGPVLVKAGKPVFRSLEDFTNDQVSQRDPRAGVGQLADGRIILVAVDGGQPGYSVGLTSFELAQTLVRLGAVTASAVDSGGSVTVAFDGQLLNRPSDPGGERLVKEALLIQYYGVYAAQPPLALVNGDPGKGTQSLSYKIVRPSKVTAQLIGPDRVARPLETDVQHVPGSYTFTYSTFDQEGDWHWSVTATDDLGRASTIDRPFRYDTTLRGVSAPKLARGQAAVRFTLSRPASVKLRIETKNGVVVRTLPPVALQAGTRTVVWDGALPHGTKAYGGVYVAHVFATSTVGTSDVVVPFAFRRS
ncbi:MAG TPA: phosphodiester glycosidase family protein [Gaiellaceae bacterium]|nr:phosphodiester glycosidase family protein [Gaiellaceae bacterium]